MKINEIVVEGRVGKPPKNANNANTGEWQFRDRGGYDRTYNLNRIMMATAMADGKSNKPVDMDQASWVEKYNVARPYTEEEHNMMRSAFKTIDSEFKESEKDHKSREDEDVNKSSPMSDRGWVKPKKRKK